MVNQENNRSMSDIESAWKVSIDELQTLINQLEQYQSGLKSKIERHLEVMKYCNESLAEEITNRQLAEEKMGKREEYFRALIENAMDIILVVNADGSIRYGSPSGYQVLGYAESEVINQSIFNFIHPDDMSDVEAMFKRGIQITDYTSHVEYRLKHKDGQYRFTEIIGKNLMNNPAVNGVVLNIRDITEWKRMQGILQETSEFNSTLLENAPYPIIVVNPDTSIKYLNPAFEMLSGFPVKETINQKAPYLWWQTEDIEEYEKQLKLGFQTGVHNPETKYQTRDGKILWVEETSLPVKTGNKLNYLVCSWMDVTARRQLTEEREYYTHEITRVQEEEKKRIARELHDDTAQSLAMLSLEVDSILSKANISVEEITDILKNLRKELNRILEDVRRFSHELRPGVLDQLGLLPALELLVDDLNKKGQIKAEIKIDGPERRLPDDAELALFRLTQEAMNNARKHSHSTCVEIQMRFLKDKVNLTIRDNGQGFDANKTLDFVREGKLGLIGMKERAHAVGANLEITSDIGQGTAIFIELPA